MIVIGFLLRDFSNICGNGQWKGKRNSTRYLYPAGFTWSLEKYFKGVKKTGVLKLWCICTAPKSGSFLKRNVSPQLSSSVEDTEFSYVPSVQITFEDGSRLFSCQYLHLPDRTVSQYYLLPLHQKDFSCCKNGFINLYPESICLKCVITHYPSYLASLDVFCDLCSLKHGQSVS